MGVRGGNGGVREGDGPFKHHPMIPKKLLITCAIPNTIKTFLLVCIKCTSNIERNKRGNYFIHSEYSTNRAIQRAIIVPVTSKNWLVWEWDLFSFI